MKREVSPEWAMDIFLLAGYHCMADPEEKYKRFLFYDDVAEEDRFFFYGGKTREDVIDFLLERAHNKGVEEGKNAVQSRIKTALGL